MLLPLKDENPTRITPYVTFVIIGLNVLGFMMEIQSPFQNRLVFSMGAIPARFTLDIQVPDYFLPAWMTLFTSLFLHAGWLHLGSNMLYLWIFGNNVEDFLGHARFLVFYLLAGIIATWTHILVDPDAQVPLIGASGAIAGVLGAYMILYPRHQIICLLFIFIIVQVIPLPALWVLGFWFVLQLFQGTLSLGSLSGGGVAWFAHIGGFLTGMLLIQFARIFGWYGHRVRY